MASNSIYLEYNVPAAKDEKGQEILKKDEFWKKYISLININYWMNNQNKMSLFSMMYLIEQYFILCENTDSKSMNLFKQTIIEMINKMHEKNDINKFLETNRLNNLDELFDKYDYYIKNGNKKKQEIEIKIVPDNLECNCDMCTNEKYCLKKMSELNKQYNNEINVENLLINAEYPKKINKENNEIKSNNLINIKNGKEIFSKSKAIYSFESSYQFIPSKNSPKKKRSSVNSAIKSNKKQSSGKKNRYNNEEQSSKEKERENSFDASKNRKIEEYFKSVKNQQINPVKSENKKVKSEKKKEKSDKKKETSVNKSKNRRKSNNKKSSSNKGQKKYIDDIDSEDEEKKKYPKKQQKKQSYP